LKLKKSGTTSRLTLPNIDNNLLEKGDKSERSESTLKCSTFQKNTNTNHITNPYS